MNLDKIAYRISTAMLILLVLAGGILYIFNVDACR